MKKLLLAATLVPLGSQAAIVTLLPEMIALTPEGQPSSSFSNDDLTLTPTVLDGMGVGQATNFSINPTQARFGIPGGASQNGFDNPDAIFGNAGDERLAFSFSSNAGLAGLSWDFTRADGPLATDGVVISGFLADPMATLGGRAAGMSAAGVPFGTVSFSEGTLNIQLNGNNFIEADGTITFAAPGASAGQDLLLTVSDSDQAGPILALTSISYDDDTVAIPEPSSALFLGLAGLAGLVRRKR